MPLTPDQAAEVRAIVHYAVDQSERKTAGKLHKRTILQDFLPNVLLALVMIVGGWAIVRHEVTQNCHQRNEFRAGSRLEIEVLLPLMGPNNPARPVLQQLHDTTFAPIDC